MFRYAIDPEIPRMTNAEIGELATELQIVDWEFSTNHWAIKDVDLFQVLYRQKATQRPAPTVKAYAVVPGNPVPAAPVGLSPA